MNKTSILTTAIVTGVSLNLSGLASESLEGSAFVRGNLDSNDNQIHANSSSREANNRGGLLGSGLCCADCRDRDIIG